MKKLLLLLLCIGLLIPYYRPLVRPQIARFLRVLPCSSEFLGPPKKALWSHEISSCIKHTIFPKTTRTQPIFPLNEASSLIPSKETSEIQIEEPEAYILQMEDARVFGRKGIVISKEDVLLKDNAVEAFVVGHYPQMQKTKFPKTFKTNETVAVITVDGYWNYHHWMFQILPRIFLLQKSGLHYDKLYLSHNNFSFQLESLEMLGVDLNKCIVADSTTHIKAKTLLVPIIETYTLDKELNLPFQWSLSYLKERLKTDLVAPKQKLYLSRNKTSRRSLTNDDEVYELLKPYGFVRIYPHEHSFKEQIALFSSAEVILGYHGAAFTSLMFCPPDTKVIELFHPNKQIDCYFKMATICGLEYYGALVEPDGDLKKYMGKVDLEALKACLEKL